MSLTRQNQTLGLAQKMMLATKGGIHEATQHLATCSPSSPIPESHHVFWGSLPQNGTCKPLQFSIEEVREQCGCLLKWKHKPKHDEVPCGCYIPLGKYRNLYMHGTGRLSEHNKTTMRTEFTLFERQPCITTIQHLTKPTGMLDRMPDFNHRNISLGRRRLPDFAGSGSGSHPCPQSPAETIHRRLQLGTRFSLGKAHGHL